MEKSELKNEKQRRKRLLKIKNFWKKKQKIEENKVKGKDMWEWLAKLIGDFKNIKKAKKEAKKMSETIIN